MVGSMPVPERKKRTRPVVPYAGHVDGEGGPKAFGEQSSASRPLLYLVVFLALAGVGWFLIQNLTKSSKEQDCMMAGRRNCAPIDTSSVGK
jgi:hypothetical protein